MTLETTTHKSILINILREIYSDPLLGTFLGFKGGTAAYLFYDLPRFSVDLDFDLLNQTQENHVFETVQNILEKYGSVKEARKKRFNFLYLLSYHNKIENAYNIKIEINLRNFESEYETKSYLGIPMKVMIRSDMAAHKLVAMFERLGKTNRDIFDVWFFFKNNWPINEVIIKKRTSLTVKKNLQKCVDELTSMSDRRILSGLGELLDAKQKTWVKKSLRTETIALLQIRLASL